jgi:rhamnose utilization protein RhaD (predicted bifunctional aldolase and dehydrogenase)
MVARSHGPAEARRSTLLADMVSLSRRFGADAAFVRAGGGNSSAKADGVLSIKPSGVSLATLTQESLIDLEMAPLLAVLDEPEGTVDPTAGSAHVLRVASAARLSPADGRRPSVELLFHALLPEPLVLHTHPTIVNALTCATRGRELADEIFGASALWIPYTDPGLPLARAIRDARLAHARQTGDPIPRTVLLQNHGLIVSGDSAAEIEARCHEVAGRIAERLVGPPPFDWGAIARSEAAAGEEMVEALRHELGRADDADLPAKAVVFDDSPPALGVAGSEIGHRLARGGPLTPDQIVYAGSWPMALRQIPADAAAAVAALHAARAERRRRGLDAPVIVLVAGLGLFAVGDTERQAETARTLYLDATAIACDAHRLGGVRTLSAAEREFIEHWEAEAYRLAVAALTTQLPFS